MSEAFTEGIAFILEGATEKVFYALLLDYFHEKYPESTFEKVPANKVGEAYYIWTYDKNTILILFDNVGTISQLTNSSNWFINSCAKRYKLPWTVYLCYDTDDSSEDISKFYEGDWKLLRNKLKSVKATAVDLAASADIEDILLYDFDGICEYLGHKDAEFPKGRKGKAKMKMLYRSCGCTYHSGERAKDMIAAIDLQKIIDTAPIKFNILEKQLIDKKQNE